MATKRSTTPKSTGPRATWKGDLTFGLVSFAVEAFNAINRSGSDLHFHQLHAKCHSRVHYEKVCPLHGKLSSDEIIQGYEYEKGKYVEVKPEQLDELRTHEERALKIDAFVKPDVIDPLYFDGRMYYLLPANKSSQDAYTVMVAAMDHENCYGVGQVVFSGKEQLALVRPVKGLMHMAMLNYSAEITPPTQMADKLTKSTRLDRQLKLAQSLIRDWSTSDFDFANYKDDYRAGVQKLIAAKVKGKKVVVPKPDDSVPHTISLMDALKKSVERSVTKAPATARRSKKQHSA